MKQFGLGLVVGSILTASLGLAGIYDKSGQPAAPRGSVQQSDYFRERQQQLDIQALRRESDRQRAERQLHPCDK